MVNLPLPPAAEIQDIVSGINQMYADSPLPVSEILVTTGTYNYQATTPLYAVLLVSTGFQKTIQLPGSIPVGTRLLIKDISGKAGTNMVIIEPQDSMLIDGSSSPLLINVNWGSLLLVVAPEGVFTIGRYFVQSQYFDSLVLFEPLVDASVTVGASTNAMSVGPLTITALDANNNDVVVTIAAGARWVII